MEPTSATSSPAAIIPASDGIFFGIATDAMRYMGTASCSALNAHSPIGSCNGGLFVSTGQDASLVATDDEARCGHRKNIERIAAAHNRYTAIRTTSDCHRNK